MLFYNINLGLGGFLMHHILHSFNWLHSFALSCLLLPYQLLQFEITLSRQPYLNHLRALYVVSPLSIDSQQKLSSIQLCQFASHLSLVAIINRLDSCLVPTHWMNFQPLQTFICQSWQEIFFVVVAVIYFKRLFWGFHFMIGIFILTISWYFHKV